MSSLFRKSKRRHLKSAEHQDLNDVISKQKDTDEIQDDSYTEECHEPKTEISTFFDLKLCAPLRETCQALGFRKPTRIQQLVVPFLLSTRADGVKKTSSHLLALSATGSGKTAAFLLPILHHLSFDCFGIYAVILAPTRELAQQIYQQTLALGASLNVRATLIIGGMDMTRQSCELAQKPHFCVATPGRLAAILRGSNPPSLRNVRYLVLDEADRLLNSKSGFEGDVAEVILKSTTICSTNESEMRARRTNCQTLLFSATMTKSLESLEQMAGAGLGRLPLKKIIIREEKSNSISEEKLGNGEIGDSTEKIDTTMPTIPAGLRQEYIFMPSHVRESYLVSAVRSLIVNGGRSSDDIKTRLHSSQPDSEDNEETSKARSAIIFVPTCEKTALVSGILSELGVSNVALHSLLTQNRRLASLAKFKSQQVLILIATDVASRGLDIPTVDLVLNMELPRKAFDYVHRVGRTARAGRRGRAISLVGERDISLVHAAEKVSGRKLEKCADVTDDMAVKMMGPVSKAARVTKMKLADIGFDDLVKKMKERKLRERKERISREKAARKVLKRARNEVA